VSLVDRSRLPELGPEPPFFSPSIRMTTLDGGLRVWTVELHNTPVVTLLLLLPTGSAADPADRLGLASLAADMLDEGSNGRSSLDIYDALARLGAHLDTDVSADATTLTVNTLARSSGPALELLSDMVLRPSFENGEFERVRRLRLGRLKQLKTIPSAVADRTLLELLYPAHPYGHLPIGIETTIRDARPAEAMEFCRELHGAVPATLIATGDVRHTDVVDEVRARFGEWRFTRNSNWLDANIQQPPADPPARLAVVDRPGAAQSEIRIGQVATSRQTPHYFSLLVLNTVLGGQFVSRINLKLREEKGYTYGARTGFDFRRGPGPFALQVAVQTEVTAEAVADATAELHDILSTRTPSPSEVELAKKSLTRGYVKNFEAAEQIARLLANMALHDLPADYFARFAAEISAVDPDSTAAAAAAHLHPDRMLTVVVGDSAAVLPAVSSVSPGEPLLVTGD
jgi:zinc protease